MRSRSNWTLQELVFKERGKPPCTRRNILLGARERTNDKLNPYLASTWIRTRAGHIGGRRVLSPLRHPFIFLSRIKPSYPEMSASRLLFTVNTKYSKHIEWHSKKSFIIHERKNTSKFLPTVLKELRDFETFPQPRNLCIIKRKNHSVVPRF